MDMCFVTGCEAFLSHLGRVVILLCGALAGYYTVRYIVGQLYRILKSWKSRIVVYADYAGCPPCPKKLLQDCFRDLSQDTGRYCNPHSDSLSPAKGNGTSRDMMEALRQETLRYCNASDEYECIITHGATSAIQLVADCFPWGDDGEFHYLLDNHTSVVGIQGSMPASRNAKGSPQIQLPVEHVTCVDVEVFKQWYSLNGDVLEEHVKHEKTCRNLFAFPMESNFSGSRYSLDIVKTIQDGRHTCSPKKRFRVLVDAAKSSSSFPPDLSQYKPDFVVMSYYKIFGYPSGLGALVVRRDAMEELEPRYFGGGTVDFLLPERGLVAFKDTIEKFENGTPSFLSAPAAVFGFQWLQQMHGIPQIIDHAAVGVALHLACMLSNLRHKNGMPACVLYGQWPSITQKNAQVTVEDVCFIQGPTVTFNVFDKHGRAYGEREVGKAAHMSGIYFRTGSLCNSGALRHELRIDPDEMATWRDLGYSCDGTMSTLNGSPTGVIRASFGHSSHKRDAEIIATFIREYFCEGNERLQDIETTPVILEQMFVYPVKSCRPQAVRSWKIDSRGLQYDRNWKIVHSKSGKCLTLKTCPMLCKIKPAIDLTQHILTITFDGEHGDHTVVPISLDSSKDILTAYYKRASEWLSEKLKVSCSLVQTGPDGTNFTNQANTLVMYTPSLHHIHTTSGSKEDIFHFVCRMRPNLLFSPAHHGLPGRAFDDDTWSRLICTDIDLEGQHVRPCTRCETICIDTTNGNFDEDMQPLKSIINEKKGLPREKRFSLGSLFAFKSATIHVGAHFVAE